MWKKIKKIVVSVLVLTVLVTGFVSAVSLKTSTDKAVLYGAIIRNGNATDWTTGTVNVKNGDIVMFQIHAYANGDDISGLSQKLENLNNRNFSSGSSETVSAYVDASNASRLYGNINLVFQDNVKLKLHNTYAWFVKREGPNPEPTEHRKYFPNGQNENDIIDPDGVQLGSLQQDYRSNVIAYFDVIENNPEPQTGDVDTNSPTNITKTSARLRGDTDGTNVDDVWFVFSRTNSNPSCTTSTRVSAIVDGDDFYANKYGLSCDNTYYYRACGESNGKVIAGSVISFKTEACQNQFEEAKIITKDPIDITENCATFRAYLDLNDEESKPVYFEYTSSSSDLDAVTVARTYAGIKTSNGTVTKRVCGLEPNTKYYYRATIPNDKGAVKSFRTGETNQVDPARVYTDPASDIGRYSAILHGRVNVNDTKNPKVYFIYGTNPSNLYNQTSKLPVYSDTAFQAITGLTPNTKYYFKAVVEDGNGNVVDRGILRSFVTKSNSAIYTPVNGRCGYVNNSCRVGSYFNIKDNTTYYKWGCRGVYGGKTAYCSLRKPVRITTTTVKRQAVRKPVETFEVNVNLNTVANTKYYQEQGLEINKWVSFQRNGDDKTQVRAKRGETVFYKILVKNNSDKTVNLKVEDFIPKELNDKDNTTADSDRYMTWVLTLAPGQRKIFVKELVVGNDVVDGQYIDSKAKITMDGVEEYTNNVTIVVDNNKVATANSFADEVEKARTDVNGQKAELFSSFYPKSVFEWMVLLMFLSMVGYGIYFLFTKPVK